MKKSLFWSAALTMLLALSCSTEELEIKTESNLKGKPITIKATIGDEETKTTLMPDGSSIYWTSGDAINLFYGSRSAGIFKINESQSFPAKSAEFNGTLSVATGATTESGSTTQAFWGIYPYNENNEFEDNGVKLTIPSEQLGVPGTFADKLNPTVATSPGMNLSFYNVGAWVYFKVTQEDVVSITFTGHNNASVAGKVKVTFGSDNRPVTEVIEGVDSITLRPENGDTFEVGKEYYIVVIPQTLENGLTVTYRKSNNFKATISTDRSIVLTRSEMRSCGSDQSLTYEIEIPEGNIEFADAAVKAICVANWDTDEDGELSYTEAAAVTIIPQNLFSDNNEITSFDEFKYFTGVTELESESGRYDDGYDWEGAFAYCTNLKSITLPSTLEVIPYGCFRGCSSLESITIPESVTAIQLAAFMSCPKLVIHMESETPCALQKDDVDSYNGETGVFGFSTNPSVKAILVPTDDAVTAYKSATYWSGYSRIIHKEGWVDPSQIIVFEDPITELICLSLWDTNEDESLSLGEAAAVTDLTDNFKGSQIESFNELKYFTNLTSLPESAFENCTILKSIAFPESLTEIGTNAFKGCEAITKIYVPNIELWLNVIGNPFTQEGKLFINNKLVTEITVPDGTTVLDGSFQYLTQLEKIILPESLTTIGNSTFAYCSNLASITIPSTVSAIGKYAFRGCINLETINIPENVSSIGVGAFRECERFVSASLPVNISTISSETFMNCPNLETVDIPESVRSIGSRAFKGCNSLNTFAIPENLQYIYESAFEDCFEITEIVLPNTMKTISKDAFKGCSKLASINFPEGLTTIGGDAFNGCLLLSEIVLPSTITSLCDQRVEVPQSPTAIGYYGAFHNSGVKKVVCYLSLLEKYKSSAKSILVSGLEYVPHTGTKEQANVTDIEVITSTITYDLPAYSFVGLSSLTNITLPKGMTGIGSSAFSGCTSLTEIPFKNTTKVIGDFAFSGCTGLTSVSIPNGVISIGQRAFFGCSSLTDINIPEGVTSINSYTFFGCSSLTDINIPEGVTSIGEFAFGDCTVLSSITLPNGVISIGQRAFQGCSNLTNINIPEGVTSISSYTFFGCSSLTDINIPEGVTSIGDYAFRGCTVLSSITLPETITSIGDRVFYEMQPIILRCLNPIPPTIGTLALTNVSEILVPASSVESYKEKWSSYASIIQPL